MESSNKSKFEDHQMEQIQVGMSPNGALYSALWLCVQTSYSFGESAA